jgi:thiamine monophosphate synthase
VEGSYGTRLFINDHLKLEDLPRGEPENKLEDDLKKFQDTQKAFSQKIESFQAQQKQKKKDLFAEMEKKLKEELEKK